MEQNLNDRYLDYVLSLTPPAEVDFYTPEVNEYLAKQFQKKDNTSKFIDNVLGMEDYGERIDKAIIDAKIFSPSQYAQIQDIEEVTAEGNGTRIDIGETLVSPTGQRIIMSARLQDILGFVTDGYMLRDEQEELVSALQADSVPGPQVDRVISAINEYGAVSLQRGIFVALKSVLEDSLGRKLTEYTPKTVNYTPLVPAPQIKIGEEMPVGFIEYLKNHEKDYDRVENDVIMDPNFVSFFENLKKHYASYKNLPNERMAQEVILRPVLWNKLQPATQNAVQEMVDKHRANFQNIVKQVATVSGISKLEELKKNLGK